MTQAQKTAKAKFKQAIAYRTKTGVSLKEAFAHIYGKKKVVKKAVKKAVPKKKVVKKAAKKRIAGPKDSKLIKKELAKKGLKMPHGYATVKRKRKISGVKKKKITETGILNRIHKVKKGVEQLDEAQHKHMMSGLHKIVGKVDGKYYIEYTTDMGYKKIEFFNKLPKGYYKGMDRTIYVTKLTNYGTSLIPVKYTNNNKDVKK